MAARLSAIYFDWNLLENTIMTKLLLNTGISLGQYVACSDAIAV